MNSSGYPIHALQRFGLGARPGDLARIQGDPVGALSAEIDSRAAILSDPGLFSTAQAINAFEDFQAQRRERRAAEPMNPDESASAPNRKGPVARQQRTVASGDPRAIYWGEL